MVVFDKEDTSAPPYIMLFPLDFQNMRIEMQCFIIALLETEDKVSFPDEFAF
jgi:hypothetical protein